MPGTNATFDQTLALGELIGRVNVLEKRIEHVEDVTEARLLAINEKLDEIADKISAWSGQHKLAAWFIGSVGAIGGIAGWFVHYWKSLFP